jgi:chromate transporter
LFLRRFLRLGFLGFGGPPAHVLMMRQQWVTTGAVNSEEFNDAFAAVSLLPGPASTQLALWLGWRLRGFAGVCLAAVCFIFPAVVLVLLLSTFLLANHEPRLLEATALGAGAVIPAIALRAGWELSRGYLQRTPRATPPTNTVTYIVAGIATCFLVPAFLPLAMIACGVVEILWHKNTASKLVGFLGLGTTKSTLVAMALKVGLLSFGGGFVIVPMMRSSAVGAHHWMTGQSFLTAVAIGQITPGPVVATVAAVGYAAAGWWGGALAALIAFAPSFLILALGARHVTALRRHPTARSFLDGAGPVAAGAILASAGVLATNSHASWQLIVMIVSAGLFFWRRQMTTTWVLAGGALIGLLAQTWFHVLS